MYLCTWMSVRKEGSTIAFVHSIAYRNALHVLSSGARLQCTNKKFWIWCFRCETVAIGNGVGCRETEMFFSNQIKRGTFEPLRVVFRFLSYFHEDLLFSENFAFVVISLPLYYSFQTFILYHSFYVTLVFFAMLMLH